MFPSDDRPWELLVAIVESHANLIERRLSLFSSTGNHTVAEAVGLIYAGLLFPEIPRSKRWSEQGQSILTRMAESQVLEDGGGVEQAIAYHDFNLQLFALANSLILNTGQEADSEISSASRRC